MDTKRQVIEIADYLFAVRVGLWLCALPIFVRTHSLPSLLDMLSNSKAQQPPRILDLARMIRIAVRVCQLRVFSLRIFPRHCLRQSLVLYRELSRMGYPAVIHFGIQRQRQDLSGHSWVTLNGKPVAEHVPLKDFSTVYSYPQKPSI
jgi:hypothetical protein